MVRTISGSNSTLSYFLTDHLGSVVAVTDASGTLLSEQRYLPFGEVRKDVGSISQTDFGYTGQRDNSYIKLMDFRSRWYSPALGRFIQPDSIIPEQYNPQSWNRYAYVLNDPINNTDPSGNLTCRDDDIECLKKQGKLPDNTIIPSDPTLNTGSNDNSGNRGGRSSGGGGTNSTFNPPNSPDPNLEIQPMQVECPENYSLVQCAYIGGFFRSGDIEINTEMSGEFNKLLLAIFFDLKNREPVGGYDFNARQQYDTPLWDGYGEFTGNVCFDDTCYKRSEVNYVAQGMWVAASGQSIEEGNGGVWAWKSCSFLDICLRPSNANYWPPIPSSGTLYWFETGYDIYNTLNKSYPYSSP